MVLFLQPTGSVVWRVAGPTPPVSFSQQIAKARKLAASPASPGRSAIFAAAVNDVESAVRTVAKATKDPWAFDAYNQIGDCYQTTNQIAKAIPWFTKALQAKDAETREYAQVSLASCYMISRQPNKAKPILEQLAKGHSEHAQWARGALGPRPSRSPVAQQ
jgi:predicted Zn-dependent protease